MDELREADELKTIVGKQSKVFLIGPTDREVADHEEVELLLEGYRSDLLELQLELGLVRGQIEDMREFINTHQVKNAQFQSQPG